MLEHRGWLAGARIADLYAGSGALGIEALSRGARSVVFVEAAAAAVRTLRHNIMAAGATDAAEVMPVTVDRALRTLARRGQSLDGVIADPPYATGAVQRLVDAVAAGELLVPGGWLAIEHAVAEEPEARPGLAPVLRRRHGDTALSLFQRPELA